MTILFIKLDARLPLIILVFIIIKIKRKALKTYNSNQFHES